VSKRGYAPLLIFFPLSLKGEGDKGGEGDNSPQKLKGDGVNKRSV